MIFLKRTHVFSILCVAGVALGNSLCLLTGLREMCASWSWRQVGNVSEVEYQNEVYPGIAERGDAYVTSAMGRRGAHEKMTRKLRLHPAVCLVPWSPPPSVS